MHEVIKYGLLPKRGRAALGQQPLHRVRPKSAKRNREEAKDGGDTASHEAEGKQKLAPRATTQ